MPLDIAHSVLIISTTPPESIVVGVRLFPYFATLENRVGSSSGVDFSEYGNHGLTLLGRMFGVERFYCLYVLFGRPAFRSAEVFQIIDATIKVTICVAFLLRCGCMRPPSTIEFRGVVRLSCWGRGQRLLAESNDDESRGQKKTEQNVST